jgi:hypothetical protein
MLEAIAMHTRAIVLVLAATTVPAFAGSKTGGGGSGGGRLGSVSSGIDRATPDRGSTRDHRSSSSNDSSSSSSSDDDSSSSSDYDYSDCCRPRPIPMWANGTPSSYPEFRMPRVDLNADGFAGAQKVYESEGAFSLELALVFDRRVRITVATSHYFENQMDGSRVTMNTPSLTFGLRLAGEGTTRLWGYAGYQRVSTNDPLGSSAVNGVAFGGRLEHELTSRVFLVGTGGAMLFDDFRGFTGRVGARMNHIEIGFRVLDFEVGPALFGPEIGVAF